MTTLADVPQVLTVRETAQVLRLAENSVYAAIHRGELPARRVGRRLLIPRDALERFLAAQGSVSETGENG